MFRLFTWVALATATASAFQIRIDFTALKQETIASRLEQFQGDNRQRSQRLKSLFAEAGCDDQHLSEQPVKGSKLPNIVCILPGKDAQQIVVGAHYDHVPEGAGVVDNWSGASLLPSLFETLRSASHEHTFVFVGFSDEERGEIGSRSYVHTLTKDEVSQIDAMVNMDTLGLAETEVWDSHSDDYLVRALFAAGKAMRLPVSIVNVEQVGSTDSEQFRERKIPAITIHSLTQKSWDARILHTKKDQLSEIHPAEYYDTYRLVAAYLVLLDQQPHDPVAKK